MTSGVKPTVLVIDHNPILLRGIMSLIENEDCFEFVGTATNDADATSLFLSRSPSIVLMDLDLPGSSALQVIRAMKRIGGNVPIIGTATCELDQIGGTALDNGVRAVISKERISEDLIPAMRQILGLR